MTSASAHPQTQTQTDAPSWVQADAACRHAWQSDRAWRKRARRALHEVHKDRLTQQAQRAYPEAGGGRREAGARHHHAHECPCNPCRRRRGEKALPTLKQQQERRKRSLGVEPGDREQWRLSEMAQVRWTRLCDTSDAGQRQALFVQLRHAFAQYLDEWRLFGALERLLEERPPWGAALVACDLQGRSTSAVAAAEGVPAATIRHRRRRARAYLAALYAGEEPSGARRAQARAQVAGCAGTGATVASLEEAARSARCPTVAAYIRRNVLVPL